ncbi:hypothetical protein GCM10023187_21480 [Nibrella viscosa]|uniref:Uncharacterized protein n=1 Tax=Nibrella viscosa TaxID=1084524 RepID=A0ABP8KCR6_9BACT
MSKKRILFIGHDANRAGAQLVLLQLIRLLQQDGGYTMHLLLGEGGPLLADYRQLCPVTLWPPATPYLLGPVADKIIGKLGLWQTLASRQQTQRQQTLYQELQLDTVDLVMVNTVAGSRWFRQLPLAGTLPVITFVHELEMSVQMYTQPDELAYLLERSNQILAVSQATIGYYQTEHGVPPAKISQFTLVDLPSLQQAIANARTRPKPLLDHGIPENALIIGGCGNAEWRKGNDLFVVLARLVKSRLPQTDIHFVWVGMPSGSLRDDLLLDIKKAGLADLVHLIPPTPDVLRYIAHFDIFVLCSREDPYPLVVLEAGLSEVPVVCFDKAGGAPELVETNGGLVAPYLDLSTMCEQMVQLATDAALRQTLGRQLAQKIVARHNNTQSMHLLLTSLRTLIP